MDNLGVPAEEPVYVGVWTNWSHGKILGSTLTLSQRDGAFLIAFLALFVSFVGTCFFRVTSFILYINLSSSDRARDTIYHQRQALLRNSASGFDSLWKFGKLGWYWRRKGLRAIRRVSPFFMHAAICVSVFAVAGLFSSRISALTGSEVLITSDYCSVRNGPDDISASDLFNFTVPYLAQRMNYYINYVQNCYSSEATSARQGCGTFVKVRLPYSVNRTAPCPFEEIMCRTINSSIKLDTGLLDSHSDFGLNAPKSKRVKFRLAMHCAPLVTEPYKKTIYFRTKKDNRNQSRPHTSYSYGPMLLEEGKLFSNWTFYQQQLDIEQREFDIKSLINIPSYGLSALGYFPGAPDDFVPIWSPIDSLRPNESDLYILALSAKELFYIDTVDDLWFSAHQPFGNVSALTRKKAMYLADEDTSPLGCALQVQLCVPSETATGGQVCSPLGGIYQLQEFIEQQDTYYNLTWWVQWAMSIPDASLTPVIQSQGGSVLQARYKVSSGVQSRLPDYQWHTETERLFSILLAGLQASVVDTATGPADLRMMDYRQRPASDEARQLCGSQKIRSTAYANFSVFGLSFTLALGSIIIILNWTIEWAYKKWIERYPTSRHYARLEWAVNNTLQLQRLAHEGVGYGSWHHCDGEVPLAKPGDILAMLDLEDMKHPKFAACAGGKPDMANQRTLQKASTVSTLPIDAISESTQAADSQIGATGVDSTDNEQVPDATHDGTINPSADQSSSVHPRTSAGQANSTSCTSAVSNSPGTSLPDPISPPASPGI